MKRRRWKKKKKHSCVCVWVLKVDRVPDFDFRPLIVACGQKHNRHTQCKTDFDRTFNRWMLGKCTQIHQRKSKLAARPWKEKRRQVKTSFWKCFRKCIKIGSRHLKVDQKHKQSRKNSPNPNITTGKRKSDGIENWKWPFKVWQWCEREEGGGGGRRSGLYQSKTVARKCGEDGQNIGVDRMDQFLDNQRRDYNPISKPDLIQLGQSRSGQFGQGWSAF